MSGLGKTLAELSIRNTIHTTLSSKDVKMYERRGTDDGRRAMRTSSGHTLTDEAPVVLRIGIIRVLRVPTDLGKKPQRQTKRNGRIALFINRFGNPPTAPLIKSPTQNLP